MENNCNENIQNCLGIGSLAPDFEAETTFGTCKMSNFKGKWCIFFSHPGN